ncbi:hypothetical protein Ms3S1_p11830 (plasmid) [Methylosinus sp. 3S-1]
MLRFLRPLDHDAREPGADFFDEPHERVCIKTMLRRAFLHFPPFGREQRLQGRRRKFRRLRQFTKPIGRLGQKLSRAELRQARILSVEPFAGEESVDRDVVEAAIEVLSRIFVAGRFGAIIAGSGAGGRVR